MTTLAELFAEFPIINLDDEYYLRRFHKKDAEAYLEFYNQPNIAKYVPDSMIPSDLAAANEEIDGYIRSFNDREEIYWAIAKRDNDKLIGGCGFHDWNRYHGRCEIAYDLHPEYWRRGIMKKAIRAVQKFAFIKMHIMRITATTVKENDQSNNLLLKMGFRYEGTLKKYKYFKKNMIDVMFFGYTIDDFNRDVNFGKFENNTFKI